MKSGANVENIVLYDWFTMTTKIDSCDSLIKLLGLDVEGIVWQTLNGRYGYKDKLFYNDISIYFNGRDDMGICLDMSGQGCRAFEEYAQSDWSVLFSLCVNQPNDYHITRLDVAFDDHTGLININKLASETLQENYVSIFKKRSMGVYYSGKGTTVYMGSNKSMVMFRCYDKAAERNREDEGHWIRFEMQLREERALSFISIDDDIGKKFFCVINNYIRYVKPNPLDINKKRWNTRKWWLKFCNTIEKISLYTPCDTDYNLARCEDYVYHQSGGALDVLIKIKGISTVLSDLEQRKPKQNKKYKQLEDVNGVVEDDPVIKFLKERGAL